MRVGDIEQIDEILFIAEQEMRLESLVDNIFTTKLDSFHVYDVCCFTAAIYVLCTIMSAYKLVKAGNNCLVLCE